MYWVMLLRKLVLGEKRTYGHLNNDVVMLRVQKKLIAVCSSKVELGLVWLSCHLKQVFRD